MCKVHFVCIATFGVLWADGLVAATEYPLVTENIPVRDPFVVTVGDTYFLYAAKPWSADAGTGVDVMESRDLRQWTGRKPVMTVDPSLGCVGVWAPEVHRYRGKWYLLATLTRRNDCQKVEPRPKSGCKAGRIQPRGMWVYVADSPRGPFKPVTNRCLTPPEWMCLDGTLFVENKKPYMVFCHEWSQVGDGRMMLAELSEDLSSFAGEPKELFVASSVGPDWHVTDGPCLYRSEISKRLFMFWSNFGTDGYSVYVKESSSGSVKGPWVDRGKLFGKDGGHGMVFKDREGKLRFALHYPNSRANERMKTVELVDDGGVPHLAVEQGSSVAFAQAEDDEADPRIRTYVWPKRVVWTTPQVGYRRRFKVVNPEGLVRPSMALKHATGGWASVRCELVHEGLPAGILLDFGREIHGGLQIVSGGRGTPLGGTRVRVRFGESVGEAMSDIGEKGATNDHAVRDEEISLTGAGMAEIGNTGFRFVRIDLLTPGKLVLSGVRAISLMRPMERIGSFKSSDPRLDAVWETAVRTAHLCCQDYLWDGIKRDRLPWMGDSHPEVCTILPVFGAVDLLPRTFAYMESVTPKGKWMNDYPNYTFAYLRNVWEWWRFTGDRAFLDARRGYLVQTLDQVIEHVTSEGRFDQRGFLDWPTKHNPTAVTNGTHAVCATTLDCGAELATAFGDEALAKRCADAAARLRTVRLDAAGAKSAAALLALGGIQDPKKMCADVLGRNGHAGVSTFYGYYMLEAMSAADENQRALDTVRDYWGGMLDMGATSFWEDFNLAWTNRATRVDEMPVAGRPDIHGDFGEFCYPGYRHSLCHGWSAGPAAWCVRHVLGISILEPGCRKISVRPFLGDLKWAEGSMATPFGPVRVRAEKKSSGKLDVKVDAPPEVTVVRGDNP